MTTTPVRPILADRDWHLRWGEVITGTLGVAVVPGAAGRAAPGTPPT
jgi:hypothetical protein